MTAVVEDARPALQPHRALSLERAARVSVCRDAREGLEDWLPDLFTAKHLKEQR